MEGFVIKMRNDFLKKAGNTKLILTSSNNKTTIYDLTINKNTYKKKEN